MNALVRPDDLVHSPEIILRGHVINNNVTWRLDVSYLLQYHLLSKVLYHKYQTNNIRNKVLLYFESIYMNNRYILSMIVLILILPCILSYFRKYNYFQSIKLSYYIYIMWYIAYVYIYVISLSISIYIYIYRYSIYTKVFYLNLMKVNI